MIMPDMEREWWQGEPLSMTSALRLTNFICKSCAPRIDREL